MAPAWVPTTKRAGQDWWLSLFSNQEGRGNASCFGGLKYCRNRNFKSQISNIKWFDKLTTLSLVEGQITMIKIQNSKPVLVIEYWNLRFVCNLVLGI
jgi:hypothetical protein